MPSGRLIIALRISVLWVCSVASSGQQNDDVYLVYARSANADVKLIRFITEFPGSFPESMMAASDLSMVFVQTSSKPIVAASRPKLPQSTLDSLAEWLVPFNPMSIDTFAIAMRVVPLRRAIIDKSKLLASPYSRLVSKTPWFRNGILPSDTLGGRRRPGVNGLTTVYIEPTYNADTLGSYIFYPPAARGRGLRGEVIVTALVSQEGFVDDLVILESNNNLFDLAAVRAVKCLRFQPGRVAGVATRLWVTIPIVFSPD